MVEGIDFEKVQIVRIPKYNLEIELKGTEVLNVRDTNPPQKLFTRREQEILGLVREGLSNKEIAEKLFISVRTVEIHRSNILRKKGLHSLRSKLLFQ